MSEPLMRASRRAMARGSRSFYLAARLLPADVRRSAELLYAWCRHCDDAIDAQRLGMAVPGATHDPARTLAELADATERALGDGPVSGPPFAALRRVAREHGIPAWYVREHLRGFAMDVDGFRPTTLDDTLAYSFRVAGVVGVMMAWVMGVRHRDTLDRAADLGIAFQLTNISRDVLDDAAVGRVYLPESLLRDAGVTPADLRLPARRPDVARAVATLLDEADRYYRSATVGIDRLDLRLAWAIESASRIYREIGLEVRRRGTGAWDRRVVIPAPRKLALMTRAAAALIGRRDAARRRQAPRPGLWPIPRPPDGPGRPPRPTPATEPRAAP